MSPCGRIIPLSLLLLLGRIAEWYRCRFVGRSCVVERGAGVVFTIAGNGGISVKEITQLPDTANDFFCVAIKCLATTYSVLVNSPSSKECGRRVNTDQSKTLHPKTDDSHSSSRICHRSPAVCVEAEGLARISIDRPSDRAEANSSGSRGQVELSF